MIFATIALCLTLLWQPATDEKAALHAEIVKLVDQSGGRQQMMDKLPEIVEMGKKSMTEAKECNAAFVDEWGKRFAAQVNIEDYVNAVIAVYEKHLTLAEAREMARLVEARKMSQPVAPSAALQQKLQNEMSAITSEIIGATGQLGAKLGADIGIEIGKEHPDWCAAAAAKKP